MKAVVVLSGGQDSATCLALAVKKHGADEVAAITFEYGQRHSLETKFARRLARRFGIARHKVVKLAFYRELTTNALMTPGAAIRKGAKCPNTVVEGRNAFFLLVAAVWAKELGAKDVYTGVSQADFSGYPDCREGFVKAHQRAVRLALDYPVRFVTPFMHLTKAQEWALAAKLGILEVIENETLTCYNGIPGRGCGKCPACRLRNKGHAEFLRSAKRLAVAAIFALAGLFAQAVSESVVFDAALTNSHGWTYSDEIAYSTSKKSYYIKKGGATVCAPEFDFAITSVAVNVELTASCTRNLVFVPADDAARPESLAREFRPVPGDTRVFAEWRSADKVKSFVISSTSGANNLYLLSADISGVPILPPPTALRAACRDESAVLHWRNAPGTASNRVDLVKVVDLPEGGVSAAHYDFIGFSADKSTVSVADELPEKCPGLSGTFVYAPTNSWGMIQLSSGSERGVLVHDGFPVYAGMEMRLVSRKYTGATEATRMNIAYVAGDDTNDFAFIDHTYDFATNTVDLSSVPGGAKIVLNSSGNKTNHRVIIDDLEFRCYSHEEPLPGVFSHGAGHATVSGLEDGADYRATVVAFDEGGMQSAPSAAFQFRKTPLAPMCVVVE